MAGCLIFLFIFAIAIFVWRVMSFILITLLAGLGTVISVIIAFSVPTVVAIIIFILLFKFLYKLFK